MTLSSSLNELMQTFKNLIIHQNLIVEHVMSQLTKQDQTFLEMFQSIKETQRELEDEHTASKRANAGSGESSDVSDLLTQLTLNKTS